MSKNKHNESVGSEVVRSDERIAETGEVFTPAELCDQMVSEIPESIVKDPNSTFLDNSAELQGTSWSPCRSSSSKISFFTAYQRQYALLCGTYGG